MLLPFASFALLVSLINAGYHQSTLWKLLKSIYHDFPDNSTYSSLKILEFGNQEVHDKKRGSVEYGPFQAHGFLTENAVGTKYFFQHIGFRHTSIDINGKDSSLIFDCRQSIAEKLTDRFDIITNIGFSEHVGEGDVADNLLRNQYAIWKNMHELGKAGTLYFHELPEEQGNHGVCNYKSEFFNALVNLQQYELVEEVSEVPFMPLLRFKGSYPRLLFAIWRRVNDAPFMSFEEFSQLPGLVSTFHTHHLVNVRLKVLDQIYDIEVDTNMHSADDSSYIICNQIIPQEHKDKENMRKCTETAFRIIVDSAVDKSIR